MRWWERPIGGTAKGRIISLLRRGRRSVEELAASSGVTDNAVRAQLQQLTDEGVVRPAGTRQGSGAGKPATLYEIAPEAEPALSSAYAPVLASLIKTLAERMPRAELDEVLRSAGRRAAPQIAAGRSSLENRVNGAAALLAALGAEIEVERTADGFLLRGYACPLSAAVRAEPATCRIVEELVSEAVGKPAVECCDRIDGARCRFEIRSR